MQRDTPASPATSHPADTPASAFGGEQTPDAQSTARDPDASQSAPAPGATGQGERSVHAERDAGIIVTGDNNQVTVATHVHPPAAVPTALAALPAPPTVFTGRTAEVRHLLDVAPKTTETRRAGSGAASAATRRGVMPRAADLSHRLFDGTDDDLP